MTAQLQYTIQHRTVLIISPLTSSHHRKCLYSCATSWAPQLLVNLLCSKCVAW